MTKKVTVVLAVFMMFMTFNFVAEAAGQRGMMRHSGYGIRMAENNLFPGRMLLNFKTEIGLSADQVNKLEKMRDSFQEMQIRHQADVRVKNLKMQSYIDGTNIDRKKLESMIRDIAAMKTDMQIKRMNYLLDCRSVLTADQIKKIDEIRTQRRLDRRSNRNFRGRTPGNRSNRGGGSGRGCF